MKARLSEHDRQAVDLVLDRTITGRSNSERAMQSFHPTALQVSSERVDAVQRILGLIGQMPAPEPPHDLVHRTLAMINRHSSVPVGASIAAMDDESHQRPRILPTGPLV